MGADLPLNNKLTTTSAMVISASTNSLVKSGPIGTTSRPTGNRSKVWHCGDLILNKLIPYFNNDHRLETNKFCIVKDDIKMVIQIGHFSTSQLTQHIKGYTR